MAKLIDIGRVVVILRGRRAGKKAIVVDIIDENFVLITGPKEINGVKRRRMNIDHLMPLNFKVDIPRGADDKKVIDEIKSKKLTDLIKEEIRIPVQRL